MNKIKFEDVDKAAQFAAELMRQGIRFSGYDNTDGSITIEISGH